MFGSSNELHHSGTVERIGFTTTGEMSNRFVLLLAGMAAPISQKAESGLVSTTELSSTWPLLRQATRWKLSSKTRS